jgi:ATP/maltotriose-dependent transcriptional regulator MalT
VPEIDLGGDDGPPPPPPPAPLLTPRETEVLAQLCSPIVAADDLFTEPASVQQVAAALFVSDAAVKQHLGHLYDKFEIWERDRRRLRLANAAIRLGVVRLPSPAPAPAEVGRGTALDRGRAQFEARQWAAAFASLSLAGEDAPLDAEDLLRIAEAAWFSDHHAESDTAAQAAHAAFLAAGDRSGAARSAITLAYHSICRLNLAIADGWIKRAGRLVGEDPGCRERGDVAALMALVQIATGDPEAACASAEQAIELGEQLDNHNALALGLTLRGSALIRLGQLSEGLALLDEGMASASVAPLSAAVLGLVYCRTIGVCLDLFDYRRAHEWIEEVERRGHRPALAGFPGDCLTHLVALRIVRGEWSEGEREATVAATIMARFDLNHTAEATYELGEIKLRRGELDAAADAFERARALGAPAQPGATLLALARGHADDALASIKSALAASPTDLLGRARLLPALGEAGLASGEIAAAETASEELSTIAARFGRSAMSAAATSLRGAVLLARGRAAEAAECLRAASEEWQQLHAPYERARARERLGAALADLGDARGSVAERRAARAAYDSLGARLDAARLDATPAAEPTWGKLGP